MFLLYVVFCFLVFSSVSTSAVDCLERLVSEMTCYVSSGTLNPTHSLTHPSTLYTLHRQPFMLSAVASHIQCMVYLDLYHCVLHCTVQPTGAKVCNKLLTYLLTYHHGMMTDVFSTWHRDLWSSTNTLLCLMPSIAQLIISSCCRTRPCWL